MDTDQPRLAATSPDTEYSLTVEDVAERYASAGLPRDRRTIQRYCAKGSLDCHRIEIPYGEKYLIKPASVATHIAYIKEVRQAMAGRDEPRQVAHEFSAAKDDHAASTSRGEPRPVAASDDQETPPQHERQTTTSPDQPRPAATNDQMVSRYVARLEGENEFLRGQITVKDEQIKEQTERARETNILIGGLQKMLTPLLGRSSAARTHDRTQSRTFEDDDHGTDIENRG
jgi:hypothetical protein